MDRRRFIRVCSASAGLPFAGAVHEAGALSATRHAQARLLDATGKPLRARDLAAGRNYVFFYPFQATPCFLLNLGRTAPALNLRGRDAGYAWPGGVGPERAIVAYSAICSHQLTYPTADISFISFRQGRSGANRHADVIHCCSEHSQFDPARGAQVMAGPAPVPLAAITLEHDAKTDGLVATGTLGNDMFNEFFRKYEFKLALQFGARAKAPVADDCRVSELDRYCRQQVRC